MRVLIDTNVLISGEKDFLDSGVENPMIMIPAEFLGHLL